MTGPGDITIEVVLALPDEQVLLPMTIPAGTTAERALALSGLAERFAAVFQQTWRMGVFSRVIDDPARYILQAGDRLEIYRPLKIDPKEARKQRAAKARKGV